MTINFRISFVGREIRELNGTFFADQSAPSLDNAVTENFFLKCLEPN